MKKLVSLHNNRSSSVLFTDIARYYDMARQSEISDSNLLLLEAISNSLRSMFHENPILRNHFTIENQRWLCLMERRNNLVTPESGMPYNKPKPRKK